ncbi:30982_t:CDS:2 [Gigaspora margarita]|uniref:30982_t:CDS:1 n=1 Tax=Gigaspora margarita TaxID=4874 RepID=A0ABM8W4H9_GIGMA|nr:30982_t:CDS:2 [Gigaspora margarita]
MSCLNDNIVTTHSIDINQSKKGEDLLTKRGSKGQCNVLKNDGTKCNHIVETDGSTENFSYHLNITHGVTKFGKIILGHSQASIDEMLHQQFKNNVEYKDMQTTLKKLNPYYEIPCDKGIKARITQISLNHEVCNNINNNHEYLKAIMDVATRWDSTYIVWVRILKLKSAIEVMQLTMSHSKDSIVKKDARRLKQIMLTPDEWQLMKDLVKILQSFADVTTMLEGSKYTTMSHMFPAISSLKKLFNITYNAQININLDDSIQFLMMIKNEPELKNVKIALFNALNYYWEYPIREALLATLLDPRNKKMEFETYSQRLEAEAYLVAEYEVFKEQ